MNSCPRSTISSVPLAVRLTPLAAGLRLALYGGVAALVLSRSVAAELPVPSNVWVAPQFAGGASLTTLGKQMVIDQHLDKVVLDWDSFNISADAAVRFNQPASTSAALNRIHQADPSRILGSLDANGQVFLINQNGIVFGEGARVNVHSLTASSLNLSEKVFADGVTSAANKLKAAFNAFTDGDGNDLPSGAIVVEAGAEINSQPFGRLMLVGSSVDNAGRLQATDGQVILAAGDQLFVQNSSDPDLRGFLVEVGSGGEVTNSGQIITERGNTTLLGLAVNQTGRITATTSVSANGSIRLLARDQGFVQSGGGSKVLGATHTGDLVLGAGSSTEIIAELESPATAVDDQLQERSRIELMGKTIYLQADSQVAAKGGEVELVALTNPTANLISPLPEAGVRVQMDAGATIDVSGHDVTKAMASNQIEVELRGNELADAPLQRNGPLRGKKVTLDIREGTPLADFSAFLGGIQRGVGERLTDGGSVTLSSSGEVRLLAGSQIDISGGAISFAAGDITTSRLVGRNGELINIADASPDVTYQGIAEGLVVTSEKWRVSQQFISAANGGGLTRFHDGYLQGSDAGLVSIDAPALLADGAFVSDTRIGAFQRELQDRPSGGELIIGSAADVANSGFHAPNILLTDFAAGKAVGDLDFASSLTELALAGDLEPERAITLQLDEQIFSEQGFHHVSLFSNGRITLGAGANLTGEVGGQLQMTAAQVEVVGNITAQGGAVDLEIDGGNGFARTELADRRDQLAAASGVDLAPENLDELFLHLGDGVVIDVSGVWTNDNPLLDQGGNLTAPVAVDGGLIQLALAAPGELKIGDQVWLNAQSGGHLDSELDLAGGSGGEIIINAGQRDSVLDLGANLTLAGHGLRRGGSLEIVANGDVAVFGDRAAASAAVQQALWAAGQRTVAGGELRLPTNMFSTGLPVGGFAEITVSAADGSIVLEAGSQIARVTEQILLGEDAISRAVSGTALGAIALGRSAAGDRVSSAGAIAGIGESVFAVQPNHLSLIANELTGQNRDLIIEAGSGIAVTPGGSIRLQNNSNGLISLNGQLLARGGAVSLGLQRSSDDAYRASHQIWLGDQARIGVSAAFVASPDPLGRTPGELLDGGSVTLRSSGFLFSARGSQVDVSGRAFPVYLNSGVTETLAAEAGTIDLVAAEGMMMQGSLLGRPAVGTGGGGGELRVESALRGIVDVGQQASYPDSQPQLVVGNQGLPADFSAGDDPLLGDQQGSVWFDPTSFVAGGFDRLTLVSQSGLLSVAGDASLSADRYVQLEVDRIDLLEGANLDIAAPLVGLGGISSAVSDALLPGAGRLSAAAELIQLNGGLAVHGANRVELQSADDIQLRGTDGGLIGGLYTRGTLEMAAQRIYPTTLTDFTLSVAADDDGTSVLNILPGSGPAGVLSAAGAIHLQAENIFQQGTLLAPFGEITFAADNLLQLSAGSLTSVSGAGLTVPFGFLQNELAWYYNPAGGPELTGSRIDIFTDKVQQLPEKRVELVADRVDVQAGATLDLAGGGKLLGYEFVAGPGGSVDALLATPAGEAEKFWAVIPGLTGFAPVDAQEFAGRGLSPGDSIVLDQVPGLLEAGTYTLLPSRYALLPGAVLVEAVDGLQDLPPGTLTQLADGTAVTGGYRTALGVRDARTGGFAVRPGSYVHELSEYRLSSLDSFSAERAFLLDLDKPAAARDAAALLVQGSSAISLAGDLITDFVPGGLGVRADISADNLVVVNKIQGFTDRVELLDTNLTNLKVQSLLLGGSRRSESGKLQIDAQAESVEFAANSRLQGSDMMAVAKDQITVVDGATLIAAGAAPDSQGPRVLDGDSAFIEVSSGPVAGVERSNQVGAKGRILLQAGSVLDATGGSVTLDGTAGVTRDGLLKVAGGGLWVASSNISIGAVPAATDGFVISGPDLAELAVSELFLVSAQGVDLYGAVDFNLDQLVFNGAGLRGFNSDVTIAADQVSFLNNRSTAVLAPVTAGGELTVDAERVKLQEGDFLISGFSATQISASDRIDIDGVGELKVDGELRLETPGIFGGTGAQRRLEVTGNLFIDPYADQVAAGSGSGLGAQLDFTAANIVLQSAVVAASGDLTLHANGELGSVVLAGDGRMFAGGVAAFTEVAERVATPGGSVTLIADDGQVVLVEGTEIDVSAAAGGDAGALTIVAADGFLLPQSSLKADADSDRRQGSVSIDTKRLLSSDFGDLNATLNAAGFTHQRVIRLREGDLQLDEPETIVAERLVVVADLGAITIDGTIDARAADGGDVALWSALDLRVGASGLIDASALIDDSAQSGADGASGGRILLASRDGVIDIAAPTDGVTMNVSGGLQPALDAQGNPLFELIDGVSVPVMTTATGEVILRVARDDNDIRVARMDGVIAGARRVDLEGYKAYETAVIDSGLQNTIKTEAAAYAANSAAVLNRLGLAGSAVTHLLPGVEVFSQGDLTLTNSWDLSSWRFNDQPGMVTLRAAGDIDLNADLTDGFVNDGLIDGYSWSYRIAAGADLNSVNPLALGGDETVELNVAGKVRTGSGDIQIASSGDLNLPNPGSVIYSGGISSGFELDRAEVADPSPFSANTSRMSVPVYGGDLRLDIVGDLNGPGDQFDTTQIGTDWLVRNEFQQENVLVIIPGVFELVIDYEELAGWAIDFGSFAQQLAAFGGGDLNVNVGGDLVRTALSVPTSGYLDPQTEQTHRVGQGNLNLAVGGDVIGGLLLVGDGRGDVTVGGGLLPGRISSNGAEIATLTALMGGQIEITSHGDGVLQSVYDPVAVNLFGAADRFFPTFGEQSSASFTSLTGNIEVRTNQDDVVRATDLSLGDNDVFSLLPGNFALVAHSGNITFGGLDQFPASQGGVQLLAGNDILITSTFRQFTAPASSLPGPEAPFKSNGALRDLLTTESVSPAGLTLHGEDLQPSVIATERGNIHMPEAFIIGEPIEIVAGNDITALQLRGQNNRAGELTRISAGRDIRLSSNRDSIAVAGPGSLLVSAGRTLDLGFSRGIETTGNLTNPALAEQGANILILAGIGEGTRQAGFLTEVFGAPLDPLKALPGGPGAAQITAADDLVLTALTGLLNQVAQNQLETTDLLGDDASEVQIAALNRSLDALLIRLRQAGALAAGPDKIGNQELLVTGTSELLPEASQVLTDLLTVDATLADRLNELPEAAGQLLAMEGFFNELRKSGEEAGAAIASGAVVDYSRGFAAIEQLFPAQGNYSGDLSLLFSKIYSVDGGEIDIVVPGGAINAGVNVKPPAADNKGPGGLGIVAQGEGELNVFSNGSFLVNASRAMTLGGGDLTAWSSVGDIDAGKGAKSAIAAPAPNITVDSNGNVKVDFAAAVSGSGIRTVAAGGDTRLANAFLIAPNGEVSAGDAGIDVAGSVIIAAPRVVGLDNIQGGVSVNVAPAADSSVGGLQGLGGVLASVTKSVVDDVASGSVDGDGDGPGAGEPSVFLLRFEFLGSSDQG